MFFSDQDVLSWPEKKLLKWDKCELLSGRHNSSHEAITYRISPAGTSSCVRQNDTNFKYGQLN